MAQPLRTSPPDTDAALRIHHLETLLAAPGEPLALIDPAGRLLAVSGAFAAALGVASAELEGQRLADAGLAPALAERLAAVIGRVSSTGAAVTDAGLLADRDVVLAPAADADGRVWAVTLSDRTGRDTVEAARRAAAEARAEAARARAEKGRFLSAASHDLRQPFQAMQLFHHLLMARATEGSARDLLAKLGESMTAAESLLGAVIEVSRLDGGLIAPEPRQVALDDVLARLEEEFGPMAEERGLRFAIRPSGRTVRTDGLLLERMLRPVIDNAVSCTRRGGVLVGARPRSGTVRLEVWDTGCGIAAADLEPVWGDFVTAEQPDRPVRGGVGLGLAITRRIAALLGHRVALRSRPGRGTVFAAEIPLDRDADGPAAGALAKSG